METILRGIVASIHSDVFKEQFINKICSTMGKGMAPDEFDRILKLYLEWILFSDSQMYILMGQKQLVALASNNLATFQNTVNANFIIDIFTNPIHINKCEIPVLISNIFTVLGKIGKEKGDFEIDRSLINVTKNHVSRFFRENGVHLKVAANIAKLYRANNSLLPTPNECHHLARYVVKLLAGFPTPDPVTKEFLTHAEDLSCLLPLLWDHSPNKDESIQDCLRNFYVIIASADSYARPSCALLNFLEKTPRFKLELCIKIIVDEKAKDNEGETVQVIRTMIGWLCARPSTLLSEWLSRILQKLHKFNKNSVLIEVTHLTIDKLLDSLVVPELQSSVEPLFFYLVLGFQHSEAAAFFKIAQKLPDTLNKLCTLSKDEQSSLAERSKRILNKLSECIYFFADLFPEYCQTLEPVLNYVEWNVGIPPLDRNRINDLKSQGWFSEVEPIRIGQSVASSSSASYGFTSPGPKSVIQYRSETGMVGLVNLGNTCYCNSVIQALYMTRQFYDCVMNAPISPGQNVLLQLQQTFAFLRHSMRAVYSPADFVKASRPPWFEPGRQQDCSEFLRYLLDTLHEQEKRSLGLSGLTGVPRDHRIKRKEGDEDPESENGFVKPSCSSNALDAISEAPEDEDMISQGSVTQMEEIFGSRSSLGVVENADSSDSENDGENILGSRGSLNGLKRWTTEENLCSDSRDGTSVEFTVAPIHDSHSNSTDSGIQSVGDSIRGSSDSMSNATSTNGATVEPEPSVEAVTVSQTSTAESIKPIPPAGTGQPIISIEQKVFGGKIQTTYECCQCHTVSIHRESFNDLLLPFPDKVKHTEEEQSDAETATAKKELTMQDMLNGYLKPEKLDGDNKYQCEKCGGLEEAIKTIDVLESPNHLKCTLMRFEYDREKGTKRKILTDIKYELSLNLPCGNVGEAKEEELFSLYAIVVHSGVSSDSGHYYTYAREPKSFDQANIQPENLEDERRTHDLESSWYIFNDSTVSYTTFESFVNMKNRFHSDTAYVLFYQRFRPSASLKPDQEPTRVPLRADLQMNVERDNIKFMREKERSSTSASSLFGPSTSTMTSMRRPPKKDGDSDEEDDGGGSVRGCGGSDFNTPGRFVC